MLQGQLVRLRAVLESDLEPYLRFHNQAADWGHVDAFAPTPREIAAARLAGARRPFDETRCLGFAIETLIDPRPIGLVNIGPIHDIFRRAEVGIEVWDTGDRRRGFGREALGLLLVEAFDWLDLHRVEATINADNAPSLALFEKVGFKREGVLRERVFHAGRRVDELYLGLLAQEWRAARRAE